MDPYQEFFIRDTPGVAPTKLWTQRYALRAEVLPSVISQSVAERLLLAGKTVAFVHENCNDSTFIVAVDPAKVLDALKPTPSASASALASASASVYSSPLYEVGGDSLAEVAESAVLVCR